MKAPDKIYVRSFQPIINGVFAATEDKQTKKDTEYIRCNLLIEDLTKLRDTYNEVLEKETDAGMRIILKSMKAMADSLINKYILL